MSIRRLYFRGIIYCSLVFSTQILYAGKYSAFDFLRLEMNARAAALGNTFLTMRNDPAIIFYNPGGLSTIQQPIGSLGFVKHLLDINAGFISYAQEIPEIGWVGGGVTYINYGTFKGYDNFGNPTSSFSAGDLAVSVGYGNFYENIHYGGAVKFIYSSIASINATALAVDLGVNYFMPSEEMVIGFSILNVGAELSSYGLENESLPFDVKFGVSKKLEHLPLLLNLNFHKLNETQDNLLQHLNAFSIGGEFTLSDVLQARIGYNNERRRELKIGQSAGLAGFSAGLGLTVSDYKVDYAFSSFGKIGLLHRISIGTTF